MTVPSAKLTIDRDPQHVQLAGALIRAFSCLLGLASPEVTRLELAVVEALNNIMEHACRDLPKARISVRVGLVADMLEIELRDPGAALRTVPSVVMPEPLAESGRGWPLILAAVDRLDYRIENGWNVLVLCKRVISSPGSGEFKTRV